MFTRRANQSGWIGGRPLRSAAASGRAGRANDLVRRAGAAGGRGEFRSETDAAAFEPLEQRVMLAQVAWDGGADGGGTDLGNPVNWVGDVLPGAQDDAVIGPTGLNPLINLGSSVGFQSLTTSRSLQVNTGGTLDLTSAPSTATASLIVNGGTIAGGVLMLVGGATLNTGTSTTSRLLNLTVNGEVLLGTASARLQLGGTTSITLVTLSGTSANLGFNNGLVFSGTIVSSGTGAARQIGPTAAGVSATLAAGTVVRGGNLFVNGLYGGTPFANFTLINQGTISADVSGQSIRLEASCNLATVGRLEGVNGGVVIVQNTLSGPMELGGVGGVQLDGGTIQSTTLDALSAAALSFSINAANRLLNLTVNGEVLLGTASARLQLGGTTSITLVTLSGTSANLGFNNGLVFSGTIVSSGTGAARQIGPTAAGVSATLAAGTVVRGGNLFVNGLYGGTPFANFTLINQGTISADVSGQSITISPDSSSVFINQGRYESPGGTLVLTGTGSHSFQLGSSLVSLGGVIRIENTGVSNAGNTIVLNATTGPLQISSGTISGGTVNLNDGVGFTFIASSTATFTDVQVNGDLVVNSAANNLDLFLLGTTRFTRLTVTAGLVEVFFPSNGTIFDEVVINTPVLATGNAVLRPAAAVSTLTLAAGGIIRVAATSSRGVSIGVTNTQSFQNDGLVELLAPVGSGATGPVTNNGTFTLGAGSFNFIRELAGFGTFSIAGAATISVASTYNGTVNLQPSGNLTGSGNFDLVGILNWSGGSMTGAGITMLAAAGELYITSAATKTLSREFRTSADGFWSEGTLAMSSGTFVNEADTTLTLSGSLEVSGISGVNSFINEGILRFLSGVDFEFGSTVSYSTLPGSGTEIDGDVVFDDDASFDGSVTLTPTGSISGAGNIIFNSLFFWAGGTLAGPGTVTVSALGFMSIEGPDNKHLNTTLDHFAVGGNWTGGCIVMSNGYFTNRAGATLDIFADPMLDVVGAGGSNTFDNAGLITIHTGTVVFGVPGTNTGTIIVIPPDTLVFTDSWTYTPASSLEGPGGVEFAGGSHVFPPGTFSITGPITLSGGGLSLDASDLPYYDAATFTFFGAQWTIGAGQTFSLTGGEIRRIAADASITLAAGSTAPALATLNEIDGSLVLNGAMLAVAPHDGTLTSRGAVVLAAGSLLDITGSVLLETASTLMMDIGGGLPNAQGRISATVAATFGGTLDARWSSGYSPEGMFEARLIDATTMSGSWVSVTYAGATSSDYRTVLQTDSLGLRFVHTHRADWNLDLDVGVSDIFAFLTDWFAGNGDFDGEGGNQVTDIFAFLTAWFAA